MDKKCSKCNESKDLSFFFKAKRNKLGVSGTCKNCYSLYHRDYYEKNKTKKVAIGTKWNADNKTKRSIICDRYRRNNLEKHAAKEAKRRASKLNAFLYLNQDTEIKEFYKNCPPGYHVDHIFPLKGKTVCGLHCIDNLQYLTAEENLKKGNRV